MNNIFDSMLSNKIGKEESSLTASNEDSIIETADRAASNESGRSMTPNDVKEVTQELLRYGYIEESRKAALFRKTIIHRDSVLATLEPLDLTLSLDEHRGIAFLKVYSVNDSEEGKEWSHVLVRRQRLTLEQSLIVAILRQAFVAHEQEAGVGESAACVAVDDLLPEFLTYFEDSGSDQKNESRLLNILDQLKTHGIISEVDKNQEVTIRPLIAHLADPASLNALLHSFRGQMDGKTLISELSAAETGGDE